MYIEDKDIHKGHRQRMRDKLEAYGPRIFDTYELLEMLLYYAIPYRDTNPIAKRLLAAFGSLDGVFSASVTELAAVDGIGEKCARFILEAGKAVLEDVSMFHHKPIRVFNNYHRTGEYLVDYFEKSDASAVMMMLDGGMRLIGIENIPISDFGSAAVKPRCFVDAAIRSSASVVILAHRRHSFIFFSDSAIATDKMIRRELSGIGVTVAEHYVVSGKDYSGIKTTYSLGSPDEESVELREFLESIPGYTGGVYE